MMTGLTTVFQHIDAANAEDPNEIDGEPLALVQGRVAQSWVGRLDPGCGDALQIAARAHHLRRWVVPRSGYPQGRAGYLRWRRDQKVRHGDELAALLYTLGVEPATIDRAVEIVQKLGLGHDSDVQTFEDAVCLTFIETQFLSTAEKLADDDKMVGVVAKTLLKMSLVGREVAATIPLDDRSAEIVCRAATSLTE